MEWFNRKSRSLILNTYKPNTIKYRVEKERCMKWGIINTDLVGYNYKYNKEYYLGDSNEPELNIIFKIPLPLGNWALEMTNEFDTVTLRRINE